MADPLDRVVEQAALAGPLFFCLDDLHEADNGTAAALRSAPQPARARALVGR